MVAIPITPAQFRSDFPEFGNIAKFPDSAILFWSTVANVMFNASRWGQMLPLAEELFIAHNVALGALDTAQGVGGGTPGAGISVVSSMSGGELSVSYDTGLASTVGAGHWNLTSYGQRIYQFMRLFGAGPVYVGPFGFGYSFFNPLPVELGPVYPGQPVFAEPDPQGDQIQTDSLLTGTNISAYIAVSLSGGLAFPADPLKLPAVGIAIGGALAGAAVTVQTSGLLTYNGWAWTQGADIFVGTNGVLSQAAPNSGYLQNLGYAMSTNSMQINIESPIGLN